MPKKIEFICRSCGKAIQVQEDIYKKTYEGQEYCLSCRSGARKEATNEGQQEDK